MVAFCPSKSEKFFTSASQFAVCINGKCMILIMLVKMMKWLPNCTSYSDVKYVNNAQREEK